MTELSRQVILLGNVEIEYTLRRSARSSLGITVFPDGALFIAAPRGVALEQIEQRLRHRAAWVLRTRREFEAFRPRTTPRHFVSGETHRFLGRQLRLSLRPEAEEGVRIEGQQLIVGGTVAQGGVALALGRWYQSRAREVFVDRLAVTMALFPEYAESPSLRVQRLSRRWGSMSPDGARLVLNTRLVEAQVSSIDYVVVHELCHIAHPHHGPAFFELLASKMFDWERRKARLERELA